MEVGRIAVLVLLLPVKKVAFESWQRGQEAGDGAEERGVPVSLWLIPPESAEMLGGVISWVNGTGCCEPCLLLCSLSLLIPSRAGGSLLAWWHLKEVKGLNTSDCSQG